MKIKSGLVLLAAILLSSCSEDDASTSKPTPPTPNPLSSLSAFQMTDNALSSVGSTISTTATCDNKSEPQTSDLGTMYYAAEKIHCVYKDNSESDSIMRRTYSSVSGLQCALEKKIKFEYLSTSTIHDGVVLSEADSCFGKNGYDATNDGDIRDTFVVSVREMALSDEGYDRQVEMQVANSTYNNSEKNDAILYMKNADTLAAAKAILPDSMVEVVVDAKTGITHFDSRDYKTKTHIRTRLIGDFEAATGKYISLSKLQTVYAVGDKGAEDNSIVYVKEGSNLWFDHYVGTTRGPAYGQCWGNCSPLAVGYISDFHDFSGNDLSNYNNGTMMNTDVPFTMVF